MMKLFGNGWRIAVAVGVLVLAAGVSRGSVRQEGFDYGQYQPARLAEIVEAEKTAAGEVTGYVITGDTRPARVRVEYLGRSRRLSDERLAVWENFLKSRRMDEGLVNLLEKEWAFREGDREYWLPVQQQVAAFFEKELKSGDSVDLFVSYIGGLSENGQFVPILVVNEFNRVAPESSSLGQRGILS